MPRCRDRRGIVHVSGPPTPGTQDRNQGAFRGAARGQARQLKPHAADGPLHLEGAVRRLVVRLQRMQVETFTNPSGRDLSPLRTELVALGGFLEPPTSFVSQTRLPHNEGSVQAVVVYLPDDEEPAEKCRQACRRFGLEPAEPEARAENGA